MFLQFQNPNNSGSPAVGFKLFTYQAGTATKQSTWTDSTQAVQNANPMALDANGVASGGASAAIWGDPSLTYKFVWAPANDTDPPSSPIRTIDNISFPVSLGFIQVLTSQPVLASYVRTAAEMAAGVTPVNYAYAIGDIRRYGADPTGGNDSTAAIQAAINQHAQGGPGVYKPAGTYKTGTLVPPVTQFGFHMYGDGPGRTTLIASAANTPIFQHSGTTGAIEYGLFENFSIKAHASGSTGSAFYCSGMRSCIIRNVRGLSNGSAGYNALFDLAASPNPCYGNIFENCGLDQQTGWSKIWYCNNNGTSSSNNPNANTIINPWVYANVGLSVAIDAYNSTVLNIIGGDFEANTTSVPITFTGSPAGTSATLTAAWSGATGLYNITFSDAEVRSASFTNGSTAVAWLTSLSGAPTSSATVNTAVMINMGQNTTIFGSWFELNGADLYYVPLGGSNGSVVQGCYFSTVHTVSFAGCTGNAWVMNNEPVTQSWVNNNGTNVRLKPAVDVPAAPSVAQTAGSGGTLTPGSAVTLTQPNLANIMAYLLPYTWTPTTAATFSQFTVTPPTNWQIVGLSVGMTRNASGQPRATAINGTSSDGTFSTDNVTNDSHSLVVEVTIKHIDP